LLSFFIKSGVRSPKVKISVLIKKEKEEDGRWNGREEGDGAEEVYTLDIWIR